MPQLIRLNEFIDKFTAAVILLSFLPSAINEVEFIRKLANKNVATFLYFILLLFSIIFVFVGLL